MVTLTKYGASYNELVLFLEGLSTDTKPIGFFNVYDNNGIFITKKVIENGSKYTEIDTGKEFAYDAENETWYEDSSGGGGTSGGLASKDIGAMTGYTKASTGSAIATTDTLNQAIGKVEKRTEVNENNISTLQQRTGKVSATQSIGTDYTLVSDVYYHAGAAKAIRLTAAIQFINSAPRGIIISKSNNSSNYNNATNLIAKTETAESINMLSVTGFGSASADTTYYVWAKSAEAAVNAVYLLYDDFTS